MQLCLLVIATQVCTWYMNNQLLQKENIPGKDRQRHEQAFIKQWSCMSKAYVSLSDENI